METVCHLFSFVQPGRDVAAVYDLALAADVAFVRPGLSTGGAGAGSGDEHGDQHPSLYNLYAIDRNLYASLIRSKLQ